MSYKYFPHTDDDIRAMLKVIGVSSLDELYSEVPRELLLDHPLDIPEAKSEVEIRREFEQLSAANRPLTCFAGCGAYDHYTPAVIPYIASRSEFLTSYTPYQAEISQGTLQYIFEYQTMMAGLTGMDLSNASMYDGATATAEAMLMTVAAAKKRNKVLLSPTLPPAVLRVVGTYAKFHGVETVMLAEKEGCTDKDDLQARLSAGDVAGVVVAQPNYYGIVEDFDGVADLCHEHKALLVMNAEASLLGVLKTPGEWGADIACGEAQGRGLPLSYGGPYIGYLCTSRALVRKMPGRLVGGTTDADGRRAFVLTMQAREQHIRREKATSNICTAQGVMCLYVAAYLSLLGPQGLREVGELSYAGAHYLHDRLLATGRFRELYAGPFVNEFALQYDGNVDSLQQACAEKGFLAGVKAEGRDDVLIFAVTEKRTKDEMDRLVDVIQSL